MSYVKVNSYIQKVRPDAFGGDYPGFRMLRNVWWKPEDKEPSLFIHEGGLGDFLWYDKTRCKSGGGFEFFTEVMGLSKIEAYNLIFGLSSCCASRLSPAQESVCLEGDSLDGEAGDSPFSLLGFTRMLKQRIARMLKQGVAWMAKQGHSGSRSERSKDSGEAVGRFYF